MKTALLICLGLVSLTASATADDRTGTSNDRVMVRSLRLPVMLSDGKQYAIAAQAYSQGSLTGKVLQIAVHGVSYDHSYWDAPSFNGLSYSYARFMANRGDVVLAVDQLGAGKSDQPDGDFLNLDESARGIEQLVQQFKTHDNPLHVAFQKVVLVGHSFGSLTALHAQAHCQCADGLLLTGWLNDSPLPVDPSVLAPLLAAPYTTLPEELRTSLFYFTASADPDVIAFDNAQISTTVSRGQLLSVIGAMNSNPSPAADAAAVQIPVLLQVGQRDVVMSERSVSDQDSEYTASRAVTSQELPNVGHDLNLHKNHLEGWLYADTWLALNFR
jgi:pimeloyl-ACP methyl ester carboxylesterase